MVNRNSQRQYLSINANESNYFYTLLPSIKYTLYYSPPIGEEQHSMLCMTFSDYKEYFFATYTHEIPVISSGYYEFYSFLEKEWNITSEYYPTTFYFYLNESKYVNCSYVHINNNSRGDIYYCTLEQNDDINYLYSLKIYSHRDSYLLLKLFFEPDLIDDNCHFGKFMTFNKSVTEYNGIEHYSEILEEVISYLIIIIIFILIIAFCVSCCPLICEKKEKIDLNENE